MADYVLIKILYNYKSYRFISDVYSKINIHT